MCPRSHLCFWMDSYKRKMKSKRKWIMIRDKNGNVGANLRAVINALRDKEYPVCAGGRGYYYPQASDELQEYIDSFQNRIDQQQQACDNLKEKLINWRGVLAVGREANRKQENFNF